MSFMGIDIYNIESVGSTNSFAKVSGVNREGYVVLADVQTGGRGLGSNSWEGARGKNITGSVVFAPTFLSPADSFLISMAVSVGIIQFLAQYTKKAQIKWPNDIYVDDKKLAGILIENEFTSTSVTRCIVGIGMNVNQRMFEYAPNPVSLCQITGSEMNLKRIAHGLFSSVYSTYKELKKFPHPIADQYHTHLLGIGQTLSFRDANGVFRGAIKNVAYDGKISIEDEDGRLRGYYFKEVQFLMPE